MAYLLTFFSDIVSENFVLAAEARRCTLRSGAPRVRSDAAHSSRGLPGRGPALHTAIWNSLLGPGAAHCDLQLAVEIWRRWLQHTAGEDDGEDEGKEEDDAEKEEEEEEEEDSS